MRNLKELFLSISDSILFKKDKNNLLSEENKDKIIYLIDKDTDNYIYFFPNIRILLKILNINDKKCNIRLSSLPKYKKYYFSLDVNIRITSRDALSMLLKNNYNKNNISILNKLGINPRNALLNKINIDPFTKICQINKESMNIAYIYESYQEVLDFMNFNKSIYTNDLTKEDIANEVNFISSNILLSNHYWTTLDLIENNFSFLLDKYNNKQNKKKDKSIDNVDLSEYIVQIDPVSYSIINIYRNIKDMMTNCDLVSKYGNAIINNVVNSCRKYKRKKLNNYCYYGYIWMYYKEAKLFYPNTIKEFILKNNILPQ